VLFTDLIRRKRDGGTLSEVEIGYFVAGLADESIPAEQVAALAMAIFFNSMSAEEAGHLTRSMAASGTVLDWHAEALDGPVVDKHSTGGVGDKVSFALAPIAAACGVYVPMISGRGLGHTGGTTDKVESIPGYDATPGFERFRAVVRDTGCAIIGQTADLAPADRRLYAIRDVTATVESIPLITASILSKKIAAGLEGLVMDVKVGNGAFMKTGERARELADSIIATAEEAGLATHALLTDMNQCLGTTAGNALEVAEAMRYLRNDGHDARFHEVVLDLAAEMLVVGGVESDRGAARVRSADALASGRAAEVFGRMVAGLGGPADFVEAFERYLPAAPVKVPVFAEGDGFVTGVDTFALGNVIIGLGGGRRVLGEKLDLSVGLTDVVPPGAIAGRERPLAIVHARTDADAGEAAAAIRRAVSIGPAAPVPAPVVLAAIG